MRCSVVGVSLTELDCSGNGVDAAGAAPLAAALDPTGEHSDHHCDGDGAGGGASKCQLTVLRVGSNALGAEGARVLAKALRGNLTVTALELDDKRQAEEANATAKDE